MFTTLAKRVAMALALLLPLSANAEPIAPGTVVPLNVPNALVCDTADQVRDIIEALRAGGLEVSRERFRHYQQITNANNEPTCAQGNMATTVVIAESELLGDAMLGGSERRFWAVHFGTPNGRDFWMLWTEKISDIEPSGWDV